ncbi:MAG: RsmE family RNA methyltransferase [Gemmatimonadota bacterium]
MERGGSAPMINLLAEPGTIEVGASVWPGPEEAHHLKVRRARAGEPIRVVDGRGQVGHGALQPDGTVLLSSLEVIVPPPGLTLAVGAGDRDRFGWLVEKSAELGVTDLIPLETERTAGVASRVRAQHLQRLQRRALEGIKQCGAAWAPVVHPPRPLGDLLAEPGPGIRWLASAGGGNPGGLPPGESILVVIGPEGGLSAFELEQLQSAGFLRVRLGPHVLRFETAAVAAACHIFQLREATPHG